MKTWSGWVGGVAAIDNLTTGRRSNLQSAFELGVELIEADITSPLIERAMIGFDPDVVFHLAAMSSVVACRNDPPACAEVNVEGTVRVLESARRAGARKLINISSLAAASASSYEVGGEYGTSKKAAEERVSRHAVRIGLSFTTLRPANIYGPRQRGGGEAGVVTAWMRSLVSGAPLFLDGDGRQTRDFIYVGDAVRAMVVAADRGDGETLELGGGIETSLLSLWETMKSATGRCATLNRRPARPGDPRRSVVDIRPAREALGWEALVDLEMGLRRTWQWMASRPELVAIG